MNFGYTEAGSRRPIPSTPNGRRPGVGWADSSTNGKLWRSGSQRKSPLDRPISAPRLERSTSHLLGRTCWIRTPYLHWAAFVRRDDYNYYPSSDPFADLGPPSLQRQSVGQNRTLTNAGLRSDLSYVKGINQIKAGVTYEQTFLNEDDTLGIVDPTYNAPCITASLVSRSIRSLMFLLPGFTVLRSARRQSADTLQAGHWATNRMAAR